MAEAEKFGWTRSGKGTMGTLAEVDIPEGFRFTGGDGARKLMKLYGNLVGTSEQGLIAPENLDWFIIFEFRAEGYVKDDDKDKLDASDMLSTMKENEEAANEERKREHMPLLHIVDWTTPPHYNETTHNLEWGLRLRNESGQENVNYNMKLLGRRGVMDATLVCGTEELATVLPQARDIVAKFNYQTGETYAEYRKGDKIAAYGLTGLVVGGGAVLAAKAGLFGALAKILAKGGKAVIAGIVAVGVGIKAFISKLTGRTIKE